MEDGSKMRTHGFERPFHPLQVISWIVFGSDVLVYIVFSLPLIDTVGAKVGVAICYITSVVVLVLATAKATGCDPADPHVQLQESDLKGEEFESMPYCTMCDVPVYSRSKHCRACNKCVAVFDHHCMWLNNCVGGANYRAFFVTVSAVAVMIGIVLCTCLYLLLDYFLAEEMFEERVRNIVIFKSLPKEFFLGLLITMTAINTPLFLLDMQLVLLHAFLQSQNLTTYEYIMNKREQLEREEECEESGPDKPPNDKARRLHKRIRTLPHCMDWIVFSRCGQRRRKKQDNSIERIHNLEDPPVAEAAGDPGAREATRPVDASPSPPGSTTDGTNGIDPEYIGEEEHKVPEPDDAVSPQGDQQGVLVATKAGCGCDASSTRQDRQPTPSKV